MILSAACLFLASAIGTLAIWRYSGLDRANPRWAAWLFAFGAGTPFGLGATSILYWLASLLLPVPRFGLVIEVAALAWLILATWRERDPATVPAAPRDRVSIAIVIVGLALALPMATAAMSLSWDGSPNGAWDAWSIWNLRAKFLAGGMASRAWSAELAGTTHPEYPLLLSSAVARCWVCGANADPAVPATIAYGYFLSLAAAAAGGLWLLRGPTSGLLAGLVLVCTPGLVAEVPAQYADIPIATYFLGALLFVLLDRPVWAGVLAGFAAWTKDEGVLFCVVLLISVAVFRRASLGRLLLGLAPAAVLIAVFKIFLAPHIASQFGAGMASRLFAPGRWALIAESLKSNFLALGAGWYHPVLPLIAFAAGVRLRGDLPAERRLSLAVCGGLLAGFLLVLAGTPNDLQWQLGTALGRLLVQWWPLAVAATIVSLKNADEILAIVTESAAAGSRTGIPQAKSRRGRK